MIKNINQNKTLYFNFTNFQNIPFLLVLNIFSITILTYGINTLFFQDLYINNILIDPSILDSESITKVLKKLNWINIILAPIIIFIRISFTFLCIYTLCFLNNSNISFIKLFNIILVADFAFVVSGFSKLIILIFFKEVSTLDDLQFQPLSLLGLFDKSTIDPLFIYPLSLINVFELIYWMVLAYLLSDVIKKSFGKSLKLVASSYGIGLLLWVLVVMFFTVNLTS